MTREPNIAGHRVALAAACLFTVFDAPVVSAAVFHRHRSISAQHASAISQRKRLHVNDLITEPGTIEIDSAYLYSYTTGSVTLPSALKFTPEGNSLWWGKTEYSVAFDSINSAINTGVRSTQFSDRLTFTATSIVLDSPHFDIAIAPQVTSLLRNDSGVRWGGTVIARLDSAGNSLGITAGWTAATIASDTNPAGVWEFGAGYGRPLRAAGVLHRITPHMNAGLEKSTGFQSTVSLIGGVEYQWSENVAFDASGQRFGLNGAGPDRQFLFGVTLNMRQPHRH